MRTILNAAVCARPVSAMALVVLVLPAGLAACTATDGHDANRVRVVAAENFWGSIAEQLAGTDADVTSIVSGPRADPHDYEPTPEDARDFATARLVIENGIGYDPWAQRLLDADRQPDRVVLDVGKTVGVPDDGNPHQWYSRRAVERVVERITSDLQAVDPTHRAAYARRRRRFESVGLAQYDALIDRVRHGYAGTAIGASESLVVPWAETLGLRVLTPASFLTAVSEGSEPTASDKAQVDEQIRRHRIKVFVFNRQNSTPDVQRLVDEARSQGIPVTTVTETLPSGQTFQRWQARELGDLLFALSQAGA